MAKWPMVGPGELKEAACQSLGPTAGTIRKSQPFAQNTHFVSWLRFTRIVQAADGRIANGLEADDSGTHDATRPKGWFFLWDSLRRLEEK